MHIDSKGCISNAGLSQRGVLLIKHQELCGEVEALRQCVDKVRVSATLHVFEYIHN
mgnify:CR=1 FL=1